MERRPGWCGIDVGTSGVRSVVLDDHGTVLGHGSRRLPSSRREGDRHEQDPQAWWTALCGAVRDAVDEAGPEVVVRAVALDATSGTVLVESSDGSSVGPALMYDDARGAALADEAQTAGEALWTSLGYRIQPTWALPRALWLQRSGDLAPSDRIVHQADHLVGRLLGRPAATDTSHALKTGADPVAVRWPADVLDELGLPVSRLPELVLPGSELGLVGDDAARATGLPAGAVLRAGMTDGCASQIASGAMAAGSWTSTLGTTLVVKGSVVDLVRDPTGAVYCHRHPDGGWLPGGASSSGAGAFRRWLPEADLDALTSRLAAGPLPTAAAYPLVGGGERFPFVAPGAEPFLPAGLDPDDETAVFGALCLGVAFVERLAYAVLGTLGADVSGPVALTGGGARNGWLNQLRTDVLGRPTTVPRASGAAAGMAVLAAAAPGSLTATAARMVPVEQQLAPDPRHTDELDHGFRGFVAELVDRAWLTPELADRALAPATGAQP